MPVREGPPQPAPPPKQPYPAETARGAEIVLRTPLRQAIFFGGLAGIFVLLIALRLLA